MKIFLLASSTAFISIIAHAQYPHTNYWFAELGGAKAISAKYELIQANSPQKTSEWKPRGIVHISLGGHFESTEGHFAEVYFYGRCLQDDIEDSAILAGLRAGSRIGEKGRWFLEVMYGGQNGNLSAYATDDESAAFVYGAGLRYRLTRRMSAQLSLLQNRFIQLEKVPPVNRHPERILVSAGLYWNLSLKPAKTLKSPKAKKQTPKRQNRCPYPGAVI